MAAVDKNVNEIAFRKLDVYGSFYGGIFNGVTI